MENNHSVNDGLLSIDDRDSLENFHRIHLNNYLKIQSVLNLIACTGRITYTIHIKVLVKEDSFDFHFQEIYLCIFS